MGKITIGYLKRLLNSFQVMISLIMSEKKIDKDNLQSHIKLFLSSAHYLHDHHGNLDTKNFTEDNEECHKSRKKGSDTDFNYTTKEFTAIMKEFEMDSEGGPANMKVSLNSIPINRLTAMAEKRGTKRVIEEQKTHLFEKTDCMLVSWSHLCLLSRN